MVLYDEDLRVLYAFGVFDTLEEWKKAYLKTYPTYSEGMFHTVSAKSFQQGYNAAQKEERSAIDFNETLRTFEQDIYKEATYDDLEEWYSDKFDEPGD